MCQTIILNVTLSISNVCSLSHYTDFFPIISYPFSLLTDVHAACMTKQTRLNGLVFSIQMVACFFPLYSNTRESHSEVSHTGCGLVCFLCLFTAQTSGRLFKRDAVKATETP